MGRGTTYHVAGCHRMYVDTPRTGSPVGSAESRALARRGLLRAVLTWLAEVLTGRTTDTRPGHPRTLSTAFDDPRQPGWANSSARRPRSIRASPASAS